MKRLITHGLLFSLISLVMYVLIMWALNSVSVAEVPLVYRFCDGLYFYGGDTQKTFEDYEQSPGSELVVIGSSHAYRGYDPAIFEQNGLDMFNLGTHSQALSDTRIILEDVVKQPETKVLIIDLYSAIMSADGIESGSCLISNINSDKVAARIALGMGDIRAANMFTIRMLNKANEPFHEVDSYKYKGYCERADSLSKEIRYQKYGNSFEYTKKEKQGLIDILDYCQKNELTAILVSHPQPKEINRVAHEEFKVFLNEILTKRDVPFLDYTFAHDLNSAHHFYDNTHLNKAGVDLFNEQLIPDLKEILNR